MLISIALIMFSGLFAGWLYRKIRFPALFGMIPAGILIAPHMLGLLDENILNISAEIRRIALIIILIRAGLKPNLSDLKRSTGLRYCSALFPPALRYSAWYCLSQGFSDFLFWIRRFLAL